MLPNGTLLVGAGIGLLGLAAYVQLAVAGRSLQATDMAALAVLWSIVFAVAPGLFLPLEQEMTRLVAARRAAGEPIGSVLFKGLGLAGVAVVILFAVAFAAQDPIADALFHGNNSLVWITCAALGAHAVAHTTRGVLAGLGRFGWYGSQLALDGVVRLAGTALVAGTASVEMFAWVIVLAPTLSVLATFAPIVRASAPGPQLPWAELSGRLGLLTAAAFLNQLMINVAVVNAQLLSPGDASIAVALLAAMVLVRIPVFMFGALHPTLLAGATTAVAQKDWPALRLLSRRAILAVTAMVAVIAMVLIPFGPRLSVWLFNAPADLTSADFLLLSVGVVAYLCSFVFGQITVALHRHGAQALCWVAGIVFLFAVNLLPLSVSLRVELGFAGGSLITAGLLAAVVYRSIPVSTKTVVLYPEVARQ
jgi:O-antigen/teichoic acid export membrane protein